jgi:hypothetical protein
MTTLAITVAILSLTVSSVTAWLTLFRRGTIRMTQPTVVFFGPEMPRRNEPPMPKVYLRTLLFATSKRGRVIESMHVALSRNETNQNFNIWVYGERHQVVRGSGLFVGETGIAANHHFLLPPNSGSFLFMEGQYRLDVFARLLGDDKATRLFTQELTISREIAASLAEPGTGVYFDWGPDSARYLPHVDKWEAPPDESRFMSAPSDTPSRDRIGS